jgi:hypothetical protein
MARRGMGAPPRGSLGPANDVVSRDERSEELGIFVGCPSVDGVDRGESVDKPVGPGHCAGTETGMGRPERHAWSNALTRVSAKKAAAFPMWIILQ